MDALVLGGGGIAGIAWEIGVLLGIEETTPDAAAVLLAPTTTFVGTSAGSVVASQVAGGISLTELFNLQLVDEPELGVTFDIAELAATAQTLLAGVTSWQEGRARLEGAARERFGSVDRSEVIARRLPLQEWPTARVLITAVDVATNALRVFDRESSVSLVKAVAASCAVPIIWPAIEIEGRQYMDGGTRSSTNADLAAGADRAVVIAPNASAPASELARIGRVHQIRADAASLAAFGPNPLDPAVWRASAEAGRVQGRREAGALARFLA